MDIMLDLETLGVRCGSVILSIGACVMTRAAGADRGSTFHTFLQPKMQMKVGAVIDPSTVMWWLAQSDEARKAMAVGQATAEPPHLAICNFAEWMNFVCPDTSRRRVWANGADFDLALLSELYRKYDLQAPWPYNGARDMRTVMDLAGCKPADLLPAPEGAHDALVDAIYQADVVALAIRKIFTGERNGK